MEEEERKSRSNLRVLRLYLVETAKEVKQRKLNFCLGSCSVFIVVLVIALLLTVLLNAPVLYLSLGQQERGEIDLLMTNRDRLLNFEVANATASRGGLAFSYGCPRLVWDAQVFAAWRCQGFLGPYAQGNCSAARPALARAFAIHDPAERRAALGRQWTRPGFNATAGIPVGGVFLSSSLASSIGAQAEDTIVLSFLLDEVLSITVWNNLTSDLPPRQPRRANMTLVVRGVYSGGGGKHESDAQGLVLDGSTFFGLVASSLDNRTAPELEARIRALQWTQRVHTVAWNLPPLRSSYYLNTDLTEIENRVAGFLSSLLFRVSWSDMDTSLPVLQAVKGYRFFSLFLGLILNIIVLFIFFLSILLIYSLLMVSVEARTFELGILRMVGMTRTRLAGLVLTQAAFFAVPGIAIGLPVAQGLAVVIANFLSNIAQVQVSPLLAPLAIGLALLAGILVPVLASLLPIRAALAKNVWDSVDTRRSKTKAVEYKLSRSDDGRPSVSLLIIGSVLFALGFVVYYLLPLALVSSNIYLLLNIFFLLLILMLVGLVILASNLQPLLEICYMWLLFFWEKVAVRQIALRNFDAHRRRNATTAIMFAVSLAFIIFLQVVFTSQINTLIAQTNQRRAATLSVRLPRGRFLLGASPVGPGLPVRALEQYARTQPLVLELSWASMPMEWQASNLLGADLESVGHLAFINQNIIGVSPNLFNASFSGYTVLDGSDPYRGSTTVSERVLERLYSRRGSHGVIIGAKHGPAIGVAGPSNRPRDLLAALVAQRSSSVRLAGLGTASTNTSSYKSNRRISVESFMGLAPLFSFSAFPSGTSNDALISLSSMVRLLQLIPNSTVTGVDSIRMETCVVGMRATATNRQIDIVKRELIAVVADSGIDGIDVLDSRDQTASLATARSLINFFFLFTVVIALVICFFSLSSSMYTNIYEQTKEIGVMLALGLAKPALGRLFIWEAICVVLSASTLGIGIGVLVAYTLSLQQALFTQLPIEFEFPWLITVVVVCLSLIFGFLASIGPLATILKKNPVQILRF